MSRKVQERKSCIKNKRNTNALIRLEVLKSPACDLGPAGEMQIDSLPNLQPRRNTKNKTAKYVFLTDLRTSSLRCVSNKHSSNLQRHYDQVTHNFDH